MIYRRTYPKVQLMLIILIWLLKFSKKSFMSFSKILLEFDQKKTLQNETIDANAVNDVFSKEVLLLTSTILN